MADVNGYGTGNMATLAFVVLNGAKSMEATRTRMGYATQVLNNPFNAKLTAAVMYNFQMEATDAANNNITTWVVQGAADFTASTSQAVAAIAAAGLATPVRNVRVVTQWPVP